ncbi:MAG: isopeptide-forming domain-containing fimbrial protein, partial [Wenzhouxiangellaceae bacterium]
TATVDEDATGTLSNNVVATGGGDPNPDCPSCTTEHPVDDPSVSVSKASDPVSGSSVSATDTITYTLTAVVSNAALTSDLVLEDTLSTGLTFGTVTSAGSFTANTAGNPLVFTLPSGTVPGSYSVEYTATVDEDATGTLSNNVVATGGGDPNPDCPSCTTEHPVAALSLLKTAGEPTGGNAGETITYTFEVTNTGNVTIANLVINDQQLDEEASCDETTLEPGASTTCTGVHTITQAEADAGQVDNTATAEGTEPGDQPVISQPSSTSTPLGDVNPLVDPEVSITKTADPSSGSQVTPGQTITYTLAVEITEAILTADLVLEDTLGAGLTFNAVTSSDGFIADTTNAPALTFTLLSGTVPDSYEVVYTATVDADASGSVGNNVVATGNGGDPDPDCASCETSHPIPSAGPQPPAEPIAVNSLSRTGILLLIMLALIAGFRGMVRHRA